MNKMVLSTLVYGLSGSMVALVPFLLLPFMTRSLSQEEYGLAVFFSAFVAMLLPFMGFGATNAIGVRYFQMPAKSFSSYLWSCNAALPLSVLLACIIVWFVSPNIASLHLIPINWIFMGVLIAGLWGVSQACGTLLIAKKMPNEYLVINATIGVTTIAVTFISIKYFGFSWTGFAWALFSAHLLAAILSLTILIFGHSISSINLEYFSDGIKFGSPIMLHSLSMSLISFFDRMVIAKFLDAEELAKYAVAFQLGIVISFIAQAFNKAFVPWLYENLKSGSAAAKLSVVRGTYLIFLAIIVVTGVFCLALESLIFYIAGAEYLEVYPMAVIIAFAGAFNAAYLMVVNYIFYAGKTFILGLVSASVAILFIVTSIFLTPNFGLVGTSAAFLIANATLFIAIWLVASRCYAMPWFSVKLFK